MNEYTDKLIKRYVDVALNEERRKVREAIEKLRKESVQKLNDATNDQDKYRYDGYIVMCDLILKKLGLDDE